MPADDVAGESVAEDEEDEGATSVELAGDEADEDEGPAPGPVLVWPPPEDEMDEWEVLHLHSSGQTFIEPMKYSPELGRPVPRTPANAPDARSAGPGRSGSHAASPTDAWRSASSRTAAGAPDTHGRGGQPPAPPGPVPPAPPAMAFQGHGHHPPAAPAPTLSPADQSMPETQVIEPLMLPAMERALDPWTRSVRPSDPPTTPRLTPLSPSSSPAERLAAGTGGGGRLPAWPPHDVRGSESPDDTNPDLRTRILPAPTRFEPSRPGAPRIESARADSALPNSAVPTSALPSSTLPSTYLPSSSTLPDTSRITRPDPATISGQHSAHRASSDPTHDPATRVMQPASLVDTLPTGVKLSSLYPKSPSTEPPPLGPPISAGDVIIRAPITSVPFAPSLAGSSSSQPPVAGAAPAPRAGLQLGWTWRAALGLLALAIVVQVSWLSMSQLRPSAAALSPATLVVESAPSGATVLLDGRRLGTTPFRGEVPAGGHELEVRSGQASRPLPITLRAGTLASYTVDLGPVSPVAPVNVTAAIQVRSDPPGARVIVGGVPRGVTPIVVRDLAPGRHQVQVSGPFRAVTRTVTVTGGQQALLVVTPARSNDGDEPPRGTDVPRATGGRGSFAIQSPVVLRVMRNGDFLGTSEDARIQIPAGAHDITLENDGVGFRESRRIEVTAGRHVTFPVEMPQGTLNVNARPWAEVFVDGQRVGETPVSQLALPVGAHEIVFRHPDFPERRLTVMVKVGVAGRTFVDFTR